MKTRTIEAFAPGVYMYEIGVDPLTFAQAESIVALGGEVVTLRGEALSNVWKDVGPTFEGLWEGCTFHLLVRRIENGND